MYYFEDIVREIENGIKGDIDAGKLAKKANMSVYEFRRVFSFIAKMSLGEYIRKRRLSLAAAELMDSTSTISRVAMDYGYDSPSSFSRAFKEFHGVAPTEIAKGAAFKVLTKINVEISATGGHDIACSIRKEPAFRVYGFQGESPLSDTECCEAVWSAFNKSPLAQNLPGQQLYAVYENRGDTVLCCIGTREPADTRWVELPPTEWACFQLHGTEDSTVNAFYKDILSQWLASVPYEKDNSIANIEVYPADMSGEDFPWEIWIPVRRKETV